MRRAKFSTSGPLIHDESTESDETTTEPQKVSVFGLGMGNEDKAPSTAKMSEEDCRKLTEIFDRDRRERQARMEQRRANRRAALVRQNNCNAKDEEEKDDRREFSQSSSAAGDDDEPMQQSPPQTRRQSSVNISYNSNVQLRKHRPRSSSDANATLINNLEQFALKTPLRPEMAPSSNHNNKTPERNVKFGNVEVFKFGFAQGLDTVPSDGTVSLGMEEKHHTKHTFRVAEYACYKNSENQYKYRNWRLISEGLQAEEMERMKRKRKIANSAAAKGPETSVQQQPKKKAKYADKAIEASASDEHLVEEKGKNNAKEEDDGEVGAEEEHPQHQFFDQLRITEPLRRALLANQGVEIDEIVANNTQMVAVSRSRCGCRCSGGRCRPNTCECAKQGIQCQVDFKDEDNISNNYPCICTEEGCKNPLGRTELNTERIRQHYTQTLMRIRAAQRLGLDWDDEKNSPQHTFFRENDNSPNNSKRVTAKVPMLPTFSTVTTQLRPQLIQVPCSSSSRIQSPDPFVTIRKRRPSPPPTTTHPILGGDGIRRSMEIQDEPEEEEMTGTPEKGALLPFPRSPSLLVTPKKNNKRMQ